MKNIVVVGGGTAGWITALYTKMFFPHDNVTVIESSEIGILGAGEGTTPITIGTLNFLQISTQSLIQNTKTTIKNGVKFTNWSKNKDFYHHSFILNGGDYHPFRMNWGLNNRIWNGPSISEIISIYNEKTRKEYDFHSIVCEKNKIFFIEKLNNEKNKSIEDFEILANYAIHFDAKDLADFLSKVGFQRGIYKIDGKVNNFITDEKNNIKKIVLDNMEVECDFIFDCSGFSRLIIGKFYNSEWESYSEHLPMKKAIPFFMDTNEKSIEPYTESIAMNYGWMWKIPLQHRYGCGYVYDSNFLSDDNAKLELDKLIGYEVNSPRIINFNAGSYKRVWIKNCMALGLSTGFIEPLEATSIMQLVTMLEIFFAERQNMFTENEKIKDIFNKRTKKHFEEILDFIYLHYMTDKQNNDFWKFFTKNNKIPSGLEEKIFLLNESILNNVGEIFTPWSYYVVADGIGFLNKENIKNIYQKNNFGQKEMLTFYNILLQNYEQASNNFIDHSYLLNYLKN